MRTSQRLRVGRYQQGSDTWILLGGEMDLDSAPLFTDTVAEALGTETTALHVDLSAVTFCDCSGLNALLRAAQVSRTNGRAFCAHAPLPAVLNLFVLTGTADIILGRESHMSEQRDQHARV